MAQECCTSCDSPLVTPYLPLSPDKKPPVTSCSFLFVLIFAFGTSLSSWDPRRDLQKASPTPNGNATILAFCLERGACNSVRKPKSARAVPPILSQPSVLFLGTGKPKEFSHSLSWQYIICTCLRWGLNPHPSWRVWLIHCFCSSEELPKLLFHGYLATPWTRKAAHGQNPQVQSSTAAGKLVKLLRAWLQGLGFSWTNTFSTLANTGLSCQAPPHPLSLHWDSFLYLPIRTSGCHFLIPSLWIRPRILLTR